MSDNIHKINSGSLYRDMIEEEVKRPLSDTEWSDFTSEVEGRVDNFIDGLLEDLIYDLAHKPSS